MGSDNSTLSTDQKITIWTGDAIVLGSFVFVIKGLIENKSQTEMWITYGIMMIGAMIALIAIFMGKKKQDNIYVITSMIYIVYSLVIAGITAKEKSWESFLLQNIVAVVAIIGINIAVFKPGDKKAFNAINILATIAGMTVVGFGVYEDKISHSKIYTMMGAILITVASISSSLSVMTK